ncbi:MAG: hypothetical protein IK106_05000 [Clostridiales bacterium]|nr:hypothetical protein [Clostridiales bacterium]
MEALFIKVLNLSITAGWLILAVIVVRLIFRRAPKWFPCVLWAMVGIRLLCPISFSSNISLIPSSEPVPQQIVSMEKPQVQSGVPYIDRMINPVIERTVSPVRSSERSDQTNTMQSIISVACRVWTVGAIALFGYAVISILRLRRKVAVSVPVKENIRSCDEVESPFIFGFFRPVIYVPSSIGEETLSHVIAHEKSHIHRRDHWWKPLGFLILTVYWFHPLCWIAYILLCRDIEMACDERVIRNMEKHRIAEYSQALLNCSVRRMTIAACPLAFGEVGVKQRVKNVLNYRKPAFWIVVSLLLICIAVSVLFLTNPKKKKDLNTPETETTSSVEVTETPSLEPSMSEEVTPTEKESTAVDRSGVDAMAVPGSSVVCVGEEDDGATSEMASFLSESLNHDMLTLSHARYLPIYRFDTREELDSFMERYKDDLTLEQSLLGYPSFLEATSAESGHDEKFFSKNSIMAVYVSCENETDLAYLSAWGEDEGGRFLMTVSVAYDAYRPGEDGKPTGFFILKDFSDDELAKYTKYTAYMIVDDHYYAYALRRDSLPEGRAFPKAPTYSEKDLLFENGELVGFSGNSYWGPEQDLIFNSTRELIGRFPTGAIRRKDDDNYYMVYETEKGYHLYLFFDYRLNGCVTPVGYGLVVGKVHKLSDFASLEKGDSIDKVIAVDDVASLYKEYLLDYVHFNTDRAKEEKRIADFSCSLHYLSDGLLKIEYTMEEEGKLIIYNMELFPDYSLYGHGRRVNYGILDEDLPK